MATPSTGETRSLEFTPTWALATVATIFVVISFVVERLLHWLGTYLHRKKRKSMYHALQKVKDELMLVGFISLTLVILQEPISRICIKSSLYKKWSPCKSYEATNTTTGTQKFQMPKPSDFSSVVEQQGRRRLLATATTTTFSCPADHEPFVSYDSLHQLHIFIFVLAANHVLYTFITMALALLKVYSWKSWEAEAHKSTSPDGMAELVVNNISYTRQSTFMRYHTSQPWSRSRVVVWVVCFFQQFHIPRADYLTLRFSFITTHNLPLQYNFHDYMMRSMEDEFETIVGISGWLWAFVIVFLLFNVQGSKLVFILNFGHQALRLFIGVQIPPFYLQILTSLTSLLVSSVNEPYALLCGVNLYFWTSFIPILIIIAIGTKLQHVVATLAMESSGVLPFPGPFMGAQLKPRDELFWFNRPKILLHVIHLVLFQDAFEMSTFIWQVWQFGIRSCLLEENKGYFYTRLSLGLVIQLFVSFSTLPLYALVSRWVQTTKKLLYQQRVSKVLQIWHKGAKKRVKQGDRKASRENLMNEGQEPSEYKNVNLASPNTPMTLAMEEGVEKRKLNTWDVTKAPQPLDPSIAIVAQNVWERRLRPTQSGRTKTLHPIQQEMGNARSKHQLGVSPSSTSSSELRRRISPNDATHPVPHPLQSSNITK